MNAREELAAVIAACKTKLIDQGHERALADAIVDGLDRKGLVIAELADVIDPPDEHLRTMKDMRRIIRDAVNGEEISGRDLASLTRRLQDVSREIIAIEERQRADDKSKGGTRTNGATADSKGTAKSGPLNI